MIGSPKRRRSLAIIAFMAALDSQSAFLSIVNLLSYLKQVTYPLTTAFGASCHG
jgi:hypothetical protein